jgi:ABC-type cobalamin/Fe3+-siderophores transport system ATPase subunit
VSTRVLTSHDPRAALAEADQVLALKNGRVAYSGDPGAVTDQMLDDLYA